MAPTVLLSLALCSLAAEDRAEAILKALEARMARAVKEAGPSVVSVRVSRSKSYRKAAFWGVPAIAYQPGRLGRFDAAAARKAVPAAAPDRARILRSIAAHDLADPDNVPESYGSGIVAGKPGLVLTNAHVVKGRRAHLRPPRGPQGLMGRHPRLRPAQRPRRAAPARSAAGAGPPGPGRRGGPPQGAVRAFLLPRGSPPASAPMPNPSPATASCRPCASRCPPRAATTSAACTSSACTITAP